jgi:hypothetical protein
MHFEEAAQRVAEHPAIVVGWCYNVIHGVTSP